MAVLALCGRDCLGAKVPLRDQPHDERGQGDWQHPSQYAQEKDENLWQPEPVLRHSCPVLGAPLGSGLLLCRLPLRLVLRRRWDFEKVRHRLIKAERIEGDCRLVAAHCGDTNCIPRVRIIVNGSM